MNQTTDGQLAGDEAGAGEAEALRLVASELSHRLKNIFAVITGLIAVSAKAEPAAEDFAQSLISRIGALARAHELLEPPATHAQKDRREQTTQGLLLALLAPYAVDLPGRITVGGNDATIGQRSATALALIVHEWATNAVKYGALSVTQGHVVIKGRSRGGRYELTWQELGGPPLARAPRHRGVGSTLTDRVAAAQLQATVSRDWGEQGLTLRLDAPLDLLAQ